MTPKSTRFIKRCAQWKAKADIHLIPPGIRGVYALLRFRPRIQKYDVVYIGMSPRSGIRGRLKSHAKSRKTWSHFSLFEAWDNIDEAQIAELEGLFREIYRKDKRANALNKQKKYKKLQKVRVDDLTKWKRSQSGDSR
jgi:hypothetical protein